MFNLINNLSQVDAQPGSTVPVCGSINRHRPLEKKEKNGGKKRFNKNEYACTKGRQKRHTEDKTTEKREREREREKKNVYFKWQDTKRPN